MGDAKRQVLPLREGFFNDGHWYVLTSTSLGGSGLSAAEISERLQSPDPDGIRQLLRDGVCLPLFFDGDCALDQTHVVVGDLTPREESEWIGRIRSRLEIPCGEFVVLGGALDEDFETVLEHFEAPDPHFVNFCKFRVGPGTYLVELYAFVTCMTFNVGWDGVGVMAAAKETPESLAAWWHATRPGEPPAPWLQTYVKSGHADSRELGLVDYLIRLAPWREEIPLPAQEPESGWCGVFERRRPAACPRGLPLSDLRA
jgi:hypothetical protein